MIDFPNGMTHRSYDWTEWLVEQKKRRAAPQFDTSPDFYLVYFYDGPEIHSCRIWSIAVPAEFIGAGYSQAQGDADKAAFLQNAPQWNQAIEHRLSDGRIRQSPEKSTVSRATIISHNWANPCTWYSTAAHVAGEVATVAVALLTYQLAHLNVIDVYHGKLSQEDSLRDGQGRSFRVKVFVNGVQKIEQDPHFGVGGDYTINYAAGTITFLTAQAPTDVVTADYHYMVNSRFILKPSAGKMLRIDSAEVQLSLDCAMTDSVFFQPYGLVDVFAPQLMPGVPSGTKIPLGAPVVYKTIADFQNDAAKAYAQYPPIGGAGWRGMPQPILVLDWDYQSATEVISTYGMEIHIFLEHDTPYGGFYATATFYCISEDA